MAALTPSVKRRRLTQSSPVAQISVVATSAPPNVVTASNFQKLNISNPTCISCHRSLNATQGFLILCSRCSSPTCAVCSRTCNASVPSMPPTPHLVWSTTPSPTVPSPRRVALALASTNAHLGTDTPPSNHSPESMSGTGPIIPSLIGKRRKFPDDNFDTRKLMEGQENNQIAQADTTITGGIHAQSGGERNEDGKEGDQVLPGCGRVVCRNCCFENSQNNTTTCYDCYGR